MRQRMFFVMGSDISVPPNQYMKLNWSTRNLQVFPERHLGCFGQIAEGIADAVEVVDVFGRARGPAGVRIQCHGEVGPGMVLGACERSSS